MTTSNNQIIVLAGFSAVGKDTLANILKQVGFNFAVSHSTRPMRAEESEGNPYFFTDNNTLLDMYVNNEIIESRCYNSAYGKWYYALHKDQIKDDKQYVIVLDLLGAEKLKQHFGNRVTVIFIRASDEMRLSRAKSRADFNQVEWDRRLADDRVSFSDDRINEVCNHVVENDNLLDATAHLLSYVNNVANERNNQHRYGPSSSFYDVMKAKQKETEGSTSAHKTRVPAMTELSRKQLQIYTNVDDITYRSTQGKSNAIS
jgi:guanylate kinase